MFCGFVAVIQIEGRRPGVFCLVSCDHIPRRSIAGSVIAGIGLLQLTRKGQFEMDSAVMTAFADQFYVLAGQVRPGGGQKCHSKEISHSDCSGLMYPDTGLGENTRHGEVFDEQAKTYISP